MHRGNTLLAAAGVLLAAGCRFDGGLAEGYQCPTGECPDGQLCVDGTCVVDPAVATDAAAPADAATPVDALDDPGLLAWYRFEDAPADGVTDSSGNGHTGACNVGECPGLVAGRIGMAYDFDGDDYVAVPGGGDLAAATEVTISGWVYLRTAINQTPLSKPFHVAGNMDTNSWQLEVEPPARGCLTGPDKVCTEDVIAYETWQHFAAVWDGSSKRLYLDGELVLDVAAELRLDDSDVIIGADYHLDPDTGEMTSAFVFCDGRIDEIRIHGRVLSTAEIEALAAP